MPKQEEKPQIDLFDLTIQSEAATLPARKYVSKMLNRMVDDPLDTMWGLYNLIIEGIVSGTDGGIEAKEVRTALRKALDEIDADYALRESYLRPN